MGPRALGNRSILADPRRRRDARSSSTPRSRSAKASARSRPAVLVERAAEFFEIDQPDPFMTLAPRVRADKRGVIPAAVHVDGTGRIQTVERVGQSALLRPDRGVRPPHRRSRAAQHQLQPQGADRRLARGCRRLLSAHAAWTCWCSAISTRPTAAPACCRGTRRRPRSAAPARDAAADGHAPARATPELVHLRVPGVR